MHCIGFVSACRFDDDRLPVVMGKVSDLARAVEPRPAIEKVLAAARSLLAAYPKRCHREGGADWCVARMDADLVTQRFHWLALAELDGGGRG